MHPSRADLYHAIALFHAMDAWRFTNNAPVLRSLNACSKKGLSLCLQNLDLRGMKAQRFILQCLHMAILQFLQQVRDRG
ncbi:hypothetical protein [Helicobacter heilmannii]|uniref:hypothetical protein n=1 Tax=Helicobacter heilmannii TaxID=35817 RepID=UPI0018F85D10|nr:hypothetical protein [Helicobacter heilmannii]